MQRFGEMLDWLKDNPALTVGLLAAWIVVLIVSLWAGHRHLVSIPPDYFSSRRHPPLHRWRERIAVCVVDVPGVQEPDRRHPHCA